MEEYAADLPPSLPPLRTDQGIVRRGREEVMEAISRLEEFQRREAQRQSTCLANALGFKEEYDKVSDKYKKLNKELYELRNDEKALQEQKGDLQDIKVLGEEDSVTKLAERSWGIRGRKRGNAAASDVPWLGLVADIEKLVEADMAEIQAKQRQLGVERAELRGVANRLKEAYTEKKAEFEGSVQDLLDAANQLRAIVTVPEAD